MTILKDQKIYRFNVNGELELAKETEVKPLERNQNIGHILPQGERCFLEDGIWKSFGVIMENDPDFTFPSH